MLEEPEEYLDDPPLPVDLRDQFCWKVKPVGLDPKGSVTARPLHPSVAFARLHLHANQPNRIARMAAANVRRCDTGNPEPPARPPAGREARRHSASRTYLWHWTHLRVTSIQATVAPSRFFAFAASRSVPQARRNSALCRT